MKWLEEYERRSPNWYVVLFIKYHFQPQKKYMKEIVKTKEHQLRFLTLIYRNKKRPAAHNFVLFIDGKHIM